MNNRLKTVLSLVVGAVCWTAEAAMTEVDLTFRDVGTALRHNTIYHVRENLTLDASAMPGVSALRVTGIAEQAFASLASVSNVVLSKGVDSIGEGALPSSVVECVFEGDAPKTVGTQTLDADKCTVFVHPNASGWDATWQGCPIIRYPDLIYKFEDSNLVITGSVNAIVGPLCIPEAIDGFVVYEIGDHAFYDEQEITSVVVPRSVEKIGIFAFGECDFITNVEIRSSRRLYIDNCAFIRNRKLEKITFTSALDKGSFYKYVFRQCDSLKEVRIPEGIEYVGEEIFLLCDKLKTVYLPSTLRYLKKDALYKAINTCVFAGEPPENDEAQGIDNSDCKIYAPASAEKWGTTWRGCEVIRY